MTEATIVSLYPSKDAVEIKDPTDFHKNLKIDVIEQVRAKGEEWAFLNVFHYWTNRPMFSGWVKGPDYTMQINWMV